MRIFSPRLILFFLLLFMLVLSLLDSRSPTPHPAHDVASTTAIVTHVVDGDTLDVRVTGEIIRVRLIGINTPESVDPRRPVECFGKEAAQYAKEHFLGKTVTLVADPSQGSRDKYGRALFYVFLPDGSLGNLDLIREGYAHEYTYAVPYRYQAEFREAQAFAQNAGLGLWAPGVCISGE